MMKIDRPDLVVPYQKISLRDKLYPYVLTSGIVIGFGLVLLYG